MTDTIRNQIADVGAFAEKPDVFAYGMLCAMLATGLWLVSGRAGMPASAEAWWQAGLAHLLTCPFLLAGLLTQILATYWELPVSTTHAIVGAVVGMTMVAAGPGAVHWSDPTDSFPFIGVSPARQPASCGVHSAS